MTGRTRRGGVAALLVAALVVLVAGCGGQQSALDPQSPQSDRIDTLWWGMMIAGWVGLASVVALLGYGYWRRRQPGGPGSERRGWTVVLVNGIAVPLVVLVAVFVIGDLVVIQTTQAPAASQTKMSITVVGHQWWWEVRYPGTDAVTANEIHIPVKTPVDLGVRTADVIHSFWVPQLNRKIDTIPGQENHILLQADRPGRYRGQCAEFCGLQHAHMSMWVVAQEPAAFRAWLARQSRPAPPPARGMAARGYQTFITGSCSSCHTIRGTPADGNVGPDLTHLAGRSTIGAVTLGNGPAELAQWITDNQHVKPGNQMPDFRLSPAKLRDLVAYLESLR